MRAKVFLFDTDPECVSQRQMPWKPNQNTSGPLKSRKIRFIRGIFPPPLSVQNFGFSLTLEAGAD